MIIELLNMIMSKHISMIITDGLVFSFTFLVNIFPGISQQDICIHSWSNIIIVTDIFMYILHVVGIDMYSIKSPGLI